MDHFIQDPLEVVSTVPDFSNMGIKPLSCTDADYSPPRFKPISTFNTLLDLKFRFPFTHFVFIFQLFKINV